MSPSKTLILNNAQIQQKINRLAFQVYEDNYLEKEIVFVGLAKRGYQFAERLAERLEEISSIKVTLVKLTIDKENTLCEDKAELSTDPSFLNDKVIILVDDVLNTGKALIYGVKYLLNFPIKRMSTTVLVDRNHKQYPIGTHYVGLALSTTLQNHISLEFNGDQMAAYLS